jgi:exoribonuclease R
MRLEAIVQALGGTREDLRRLSKTIPRLIKAGAVVTVKGHLLALPFGGGAGAREPEAELLEGTILFRPSGSARVVFDAVPGSPPREQLHIDADDTHVALHGDRVLVKLNANRRDRQRRRRLGTGTVVRVVERPGR